jgi:REP element-mobilizing transposase RayT
VDAMSRPLRLQLPGGIYHVTARGNARRSIFEDDDDCARFLTVLAGTVARYRVFCHAYCLMGNHYHLLLQTLEANLSIVMRHHYATISGSWRTPPEWRNAGPNPELERGWTGDDGKNVVIQDLTPG